MFTSAQGDTSESYCYLFCLFLKLLRSHDVAQAGPELVVKAVASAS